MAKLEQEDVERRLGVTGGTDMHLVGQHRFEAEQLLAMLLGILLVIRCSKKCCGSRSIHCVWGTMWRGSVTILLSCTGAIRSVMEGSRFASVAENLYAGRWALNKLPGGKALCSSGVNDDNL